MNLISRTVDFDCLTLYLEWDYKDEKISNIWPNLLLSTLMPIIQICISIPVYIIWELIVQGYDQTRVKLVKDKITCAFVICCWLCYVDITEWVTTVFSCRHIDGLEEPNRLFYDPAVVCY
jgi:hypothetical protein